MMSAPRKIIGSLKMRGLKKDTFSVKKRAAKRRKRATGWVPNGGQQNAVDAAQLDVDLETEVAQRLRRRLDHVLRLHALRRQTEHRVADALHLR